METDIPKKELTTEERLRAEVESLQRQLEEQSGWRLKPRRTQLKLSRHRG